jgi:CcmD family protein
MTLMTRARAAVLTIAIALLPPAVAMAQVFEKVEGKVADEIPAVPFVAAAYGFIWVAVLGYLLYVARSVTRVSQEVAELRRKLDAGNAPGARPGQGRTGS